MNVLNCLSLYSLLILVIRVLISNNNSPFNTQQAIPTSWLHPQNKQVCIYRIHMNKVYQGRLSTHYKINPLTTAWTNGFLSWSTLPPYLLPTYQDFSRQANNSCCRVLSSTKKTGQAFHTPCRLPLKT